MSQRFKTSLDKRPNSFILGSFHHAVCEGDMKKVKEFIEGASSGAKTSVKIVACNQQDEVNMLSRAGIIPGLIL